MHSHSYFDRRGGGPVYLQTLTVPVQGTPQWPFVNLERISRDYTDTNMNS